jgi:hypothetical protein
MVVSYPESFKGTLSSTNSKATRERLEERGLLAEIAPKGNPAPLTATKRWVVEEYELLAQRPQEALLVYRKAGAGD